jgi:hypothetical protein
MCKFLFLSSSFHLSFRKDEFSFLLFIQTFGHWYEKNENKKEEEREEKILLPN